MLSMFMNFQVPDSSADSESEAKLKYFKVIFPNIPSGNLFERTGMASGRAGLTAAGTGFTNISTIFLSFFFYLFSKLLLNCF
jgi:hypothetical protein